MELIMNANIANHQIPTGRPSYPLVTACADSCKELASETRSLKRALLTEFTHGPYGRNPMFELALNEAEAVAHQTDFPYLVFPILAREKVEAVAAWNLHQRAVRERSHRLN
jgi:hypothetical protein